MLDGRSSPLASGASLGARWPWGGRARETPMVTESTTTFGALLRQHRLAAGLTQEQLAERAGMSVFGIQKLERGTTHPYRDTAARLTAALELPPDEAERFRAAVAPVRRRAARRARAAHRPAPQPADRADQLRRPRAGARQHSAAAASRPIAHADRRRRLRQDPTCDRACPEGWPTPIPTACGWWSWPRSRILPSSRIGLRPSCASRKPPNGHSSRRSPTRCAINSCCLSWTTASTCSTPARRWSTSCCASAERSRFWPPVANRSASPAK